MFTFDSSYFSSLFRAISNLFGVIYNVFVGAFEVLTQPLSETLAGWVSGSNLPPVVSEVTASLLRYLVSSTLGDFSLIELMLGFGLGIYIIWQLVSWVLNIFP